MAYTEPRCSRCNLIVSLERLFKKTASFYSKKTNKLVRQRVVEWLCDECMEGDEDYNRPSYSGPGHTSPALERARSIDRNVS